MRRLGGLLTLAVAAVLVAGGGLAQAAFTTHESNAQTFTAGQFAGPANLVAKSRTNDGGATAAGFNFGLALTNTGASATALSSVTMRYWFTGDSAPGLIPDCYYAVFGCSNITHRVVAVDPIRNGGDHYSEVAFTGGSLAAGATVSLDQLAVRTNGGTLKQDNDYSFLNQTAFTQNPKVTVYVAGKLVFGTEPAVVAPVAPSVEVRYTNISPGNTGDPSIEPRLAVNNTGSTSIDLSKLTLRYWYTRDNDVTQYSTCNYFAQPSGCSQITTETVKVTPLNKADTYVKVGFTGGTLGVGGTTGDMNLQIRTDGVNYNETNDYSWGSNASPVSSLHVTAYLNGTLIWGTEPQPKP